MYSRVLGVWLVSSSACSLASHVREGRSIVSGVSFEASWQRPSWSSSLSLVSQAAAAVLPPSEIGGMPLASRMSSPNALERRAGYRAGAARLRVVAAQLHVVAFAHARSVARGSAQRRLEGDARCCARWAHEDEGIVPNALQYALSERALP